MTVEAITTPPANTPDLSGIDINAAPNAVNPDRVVETPVITPEPIPAPVESVVEQKPAETLLADGIDKSQPAPETQTPPVEQPAPEAVVDAAEAAKQNEGGQSDETAPPPESQVKPVYDPFTLPEGVSLSDDRVGKFTELLSELETGGNVDHSLVQAFGQKAVDFYLNEVKEVAENITKSYQTAWAKQVNDWKDDFLADPVIGGNRFQTTVDSALTFIRTHGGTAEEQKEFRDLMETTGLGNNKVMIRILAKAGQAMSEPKPLAASQPAPISKSKVETLYGRNK